MIALRSSDEMFMTILICEMLIIIPVAVFMIVCMWKIFEKAGQEGWKAIIPIYGTYIMVTKIAGKDDNHFVLHLIPIINIYATIVTYMAVAKSFGKDDGFGIGLFLLGIVFWPWLAFSKEINYVGPGGVAKVQDSTNSLTTDWQNPDKPSNV